ncbi:caskin-2 isoform X5 [Schistocerca serialis cubense]|uniref:caskin-2 isoform X5 n=1 Tax=Schistocerca serialis cubense TaxID=2023355 RepID=UPI00214F5480|nr:caskin-2 isoform X5 [Schistocerca serialis cubense]
MCFWSWVTAALAPRHHRPQQRDHQVLYRPTACPVGGMSRPPKPAPQVKKVAPPAVPDQYQAQQQQQQQGQQYRLSGSSFGSAGYSSSSDDGLLTPADVTPQQQAAQQACDHSEVYELTGKSPGAQFSYPAFTFPGPQGVQYTQLMHSGKSAAYYHQMSLQEDQGIDMTQSPGRDSPGSSGSGSGSGSRHSTASLDSGRASGYHLLGPSSGGTGVRGPGPLSSSPRCSLSSSSLASSELGGPAARAERLLQQGVPDQDVLHAWLMDLHFEEYFPLFASAGYDMPTICKMTPEDLTAIGIKKPNHRKKLKAEIAQLNISDGLPDYIPGSLDEWLRLLRLEEYGPALHQQCYKTVEDVTQLTWEDLEDIGIVKLGHQKKILLAIKRVKDIRAGKRFPPQPSLAGPSQIRGGRGKSLESLEDGSERTHHTFSADNTQTFYYQHAVHGPGGWRPRSYDDGDITPTNEAVALHEGGGTLPRPRGLVRPRPVAKIVAKTRNDGSTFAVPDFEKPGSTYYKSLPRDLIDVSKYDLDRYSGGTGNESPRMAQKKRPPSPPKRQSSRTGEADVVIDCSGPVPRATADVPGSGGRTTVVTVDLHSTDRGTSVSPLSLPAYPSGTGDDLAEPDLPLPPPPAPPSPPGLRELSTMSRSWSNMPTTSEAHAASVEQELIASLAMQQGRNGSDASFKSSSSTESDSLPFANENAGTIKQRVTRPHPTLTTMDYPKQEFTPSKRVQNPQSDLAASQKALRDRSASQEPADVLNDIGNMLANLTDELDAMLEEEKRQGLNQ